MDLTGSLPTHETLTYDTRPLTDISMLVLHHTATPQSTTPQSVAEYHVTTNGWPGIGYQLWVDAAGVVSVCHEPTVVSYHVGDANRSALGICVPGDYRMMAVTAATQATLARLVPWLRTWLGRDVPVVAHGDVPGNSTGCPGVNLEALIPALNAGEPNIEGLRNAAWQARFAGPIPYNPDAAFVKYARAHNLGAPETPEFDSAPWVGQGFAGAIVYTQPGDWGNVRQVGW